jgi:hypothetical protein
MRKRKEPEIPATRAKVTDDDATIYATLREEFTAADLQKYTEIEPLTPADLVLQQLEAAQRRAEKKRKR